MDRISHEVIDGQFVNTKVSQVVQAIKEYEPEIEVQFIPVGARTEGQAAYRLVHHPKNREPYVMFTVRRDEDFDERILQKIIMNDQRHGQVTLSEIEAFEAAKMGVERQAYLDKLEEAHDIAYHVMKSPLNVYKVDKDTTIRDYGGLIT